MRDKGLHGRILGIRSLWNVAGVELSAGPGAVKVFVEQEAGAEQRCRKCGAVCAGDDRRRREWRRLDNCQFKTMLVVEMPRVECPEDGVVPVEVRWVERRSGLTALFEGLVIGG